MKMKSKTISPSVFFYFDGSEILVKLRVKWWKLVDGAVESAVVVTQDLTEEEGSKRNVHNNALNTQKIWSLNIS